MAKRAKKESEAVATGDSLSVCVKELAALARPFSFFKGSLHPDFHVYLSGNKVTLTASNGMCRLARSMTAANTVDVARDGEVGADTFTKTMANLTGMVDLKFADGKLVVSQEGKQFSLTQLEGETVKFVGHKGNGITINGQTFKPTH